MKKYYLILPLIMLLSVSAFSQTKAFSLGFNLGYSKIVSESGNYWLGGFYGGADFLIKVSPIFSPGLMISYNHYAPDVDALIYSVDPRGIFDTTVSGSGSYFEIVPIAQFNVVQNPKTTFFLRTGLGVNIINLDALVEASYWIFHISVPVKESATRPTTVFGFGVDIGGRESLKFEILTLFHLTFIEGGTSSFLSIGLGLRY